MFGIGKNKKTERVFVQDQQNYLVVDIGTEYIKTAVCRLNARREVEVVGYDRTKQKYEAMSGAMITDLPEVINTVDLSVGAALAAAESNMGSVSNLPEGMMLGIAGELIKGVTLFVNYDREDPNYEIEQAEIDDVIEQIREQAYPGAMEEVATELNLPAEQLVELESHVVNTEIDGVVVENPLGFKGRHILYRIYVTFAPRIHLQALENVATKLRLKPIATVVTPYAIAVGAKQAKANKFSGIFIDIGGGTTDIAVVKNGVIVGTNMFAYGGRVFTKRIQLNMALDYEQAEQLKLDYALGKLKGKQAAEVKDAVAADLAVWLDAVAIALNDFADIDSYPGQIYLCGGGAMLPDIVTAMQEYPWLKTLPFQRFPKINLLLPNQIEGVADLTRSVSQPNDVTPMSLCRMLIDYLR